MTTNIQVAIRARPLIPTEQVKNLRIQWGIQNTQIFQIDENGPCAEPYCFDHIFGMNKTNSEIYKEIVQEFVCSSLHGLSSTIFAYGQTSSGKTFTMLGNKKDRGIMALAIENIFETIENSTDKKFLIRVSYLEIYNEKISDLLDPSNNNIRIRESYQGVFKLQNIKEEIVTNRKEMFECLKIGIENRHIAATKANDRSSRSHTIFKIMIESTKVSDDENTGSIRASVLNLVDLAGSERVAQTGATGIRLKEGGHINKSLSALGLVILQLSDGQDFVNFRDSKLTCLLRDSLGGNSKTLIIATVTLASLDDTNSTLAFAQRAKAVKNKPQINEIVSAADASKRYAAINAQLNKKLEEQVQLNKNLEHKQAANREQMELLKHKIQCLEHFQSGKVDDSFKRNPKRRHTIGFCSKKNLFAFKDEDLESEVFNPDDLPSFEELLKRDNLKRLTIVEEDATPSKSILDANLTGHSPFIQETRTPVSCLRSRLHQLEKSHNELLTYTRDEESTLCFTYEKADQLTKELETARIQLQQYHKDEEQFKVREKQLMEKIEELEATMSDLKNENVDPDFECIKEQLGNLHAILYPKNKSDYTTVTLDQMETGNSQETLELDILEKNKLINELENKCSVLSTKLDDVLNQCQAKEQSWNKEIEDLKTQIDTFTLQIKEFAEGQDQKQNLERDILERDKTINELEHKCTEFATTLDDVLNQCQDKERSWNKENEDLKKQIDSLNLQIIEKDRIKKKMDHKEIEEISIAREEKQTNTSQIEGDACLTNDILEKNKTISELENKCTTLSATMDDVLNQCQTKEQSWSKEISDLKEQIDTLSLQLIEKDKVMTTMHTNDEYNKDIDDLNNKIQEVILEVREKDKTIGEMEDNISRLQDQVNRLMVPIGSNELHLEIERLKEEMENVFKSKSDLENHCSSLHKQVNSLNQERLAICVQKTTLEFENERLLGLLNDTKKNEEQPNFVALQEQQQKEQLLSRELKEALLKIDELKQQFLVDSQEHKEREERLAGELKEAVLKIDDLKLQLGKGDKDLQQCQVVNEELRGEIKQLKMKDQHELVRKTKIVDNELVSINERFKLTICRIMEYIINEVPRLVNSEPHEDILVGLVQISTVLRHKLQLLEMNEINVNEVVEKVADSYTCLINYFLSNEAKFKSEVSELKSVNADYLNELAVLRNQQAERLVCSECESMKIELERLKAVISSNENELASRKKTLSDMRKENMAIIGENAKLRRQLMQEERKKKELEHEEWMNYYITNDKNQREELKKQHREIQRLLQKIDEFERTVTKVGNRTSVQVQCDVFESNLKEKYEHVKSICVSRKEEIVLMKSEIEKLKSRMLECENRHPLVDKTNISGDNESVKSENGDLAVLQEKYNVVKKVCLMRKEEIKALKTELQAIKGK